jgi:hypothetical protein
MPFMVTSRKKRSRGVQEYVIYLGPSRCQKLTVSSQQSEVSKTWVTFILDAVL